MTEKSNVFLNYELKFHIFITKILILVNIINFSYCSICSQKDKISNKTCFNDVLIFDNKKYRAGHFVTYKNGDMIAEFSDDGGSTTDGYARIFYGLKTNGRYYFPNENPTFEIENIGIIDGDRGRYESLNEIVVTEDDLTKENEFLFSTSSYGSLTELHMINNRTYIYTKTNTFFGEMIFSFQYSMVEVEYNSNDKK